MARDASADLPSEPSAGSAPVGDVELFDYTYLRDRIGFILRGPLRHKGLAATAFAVVAILGALAGAILPVRYQVQAKVLAVRSPLMATLSNPGLNRDWDAPTRAAREVLIRRDNLVALAKQTDLADRYLRERAPAVVLRDQLVKAITGRERSPDKLLEDLVDTLEDRLQVWTSPEGTVTITFQWSNPETALRIVQAAVQSFLEARYASEITAVGETVAILEGHDARLQREITDSLSHLEQTQRTVRDRTTAPSAAKRPRPLSRYAVGDSEEVTRLKGRLAARQRALSDLEGFRRRRIEELQDQLREQLTVYAPRHPEVMKTEQSIEALKLKSPQIETLRAEVEELESELASGERRSPVPHAVVPPAAEPTGPVFTGADPRVEYDRWQLELLERQHTYLLDRINAARVEMDTAQAAFKYRYNVITPPQIPRKPIKQYKSVALVGGLLGGVALALFASTVADRRSRRVVERWQVERTAGLRVLAENKKT